MLGTLAAIGGIVLVMMLPDESAQKALRAVIMPVLGMRGSGTSVVAGIRHRAGVPMGSEHLLWPRPNDENPLGFFEDARFRLVNAAVRAAHR